MSSAKAVLELVARWLSNALEPNAPHLQGEHHTVYTNPNQYSQPYRGEISIPAGQALTITWPSVVELVRFYAAAPGLYLYQDAGKTVDHRVPILDGTLFGWDVSYGRRKLDVIDNPTAGAITLHWDAAATDVAPEAFASQRPNVGLYTGLA